MEYFLMKKIVLVEDDQRLADLVKDFLSQHAFTVIVLNSGENAVSTIRNEAPDIVLLDIMLPDTDGFSICREIRNFYKQPVLFLTAKDSPIDHVMGLEIGADDYIIKPIDPHVLLARIHTVLRRSNESIAVQEDTITFDLLHINKTSRTVAIDDHNVDLTSHEFELLCLLAENAGSPLSRDRIHENMIGREYDGLDRSVDVRVSRLRKKLHDDCSNPARIVTVWGKGYMLIPTAWKELRVN
jgi:DNA-binding response OmpR family regulator